jgi:aminopeptidase N
MVLFRQLEVLTSRDQVLAAIKSVLGHPHSLSIDELVTALSMNTGLDLTSYAAAWLHGMGKPAWPTVNATFTASTSTLTVHQTTSPNRTCKFHIALQGATPDEQQLVEVDTFRNGLDQTISVPTPAFTVTDVLIDPLNECLVYGSGVIAAQRIEPWVAH